MSLAMHEQYDREHYARVAALLLSGDVQARVIAGAYLGVEVRRGSESIVWSNAAGDHWAWTSVDLTTGEATTGWSDVPWDALPVDVAIGIWQTYAVDDDSKES